MFKENLPQFLGSKAHGFFQENSFLDWKVNAEIEVHLITMYFCTKNLDITILAELILQLKRQEKDTNC